MRKTLVGGVIVLSLLVLLTVSTAGTGVLGTWRDINPTSYISPPSNPPLNSVYMLSANEGWAIGDSIPTTDTAPPLHDFPAILHYDGSTWNLVPAPKYPTDSQIIPSGYTLTSLSFGPAGAPISRNDGWAVGFGFQGVGGPCATMNACAVALHWDGITWKPELSGLAGPDAGPLFSVFMVSPTDVWAVGQNNAGTAGVFWHWTGVPGLGGGWNEPQAAVGPAPPTSTIFHSVYMVSASEGWAVGSCTGAGCTNIYHYFGGTWTAAPSPVIATPLRSIFMISPTDGWAVGDGGTIIHYTTGSWAGPVSPGTTVNNLHSVFMASSTEGWAVGDAGSLLHYSGGTWTLLPINLVPALPAAGFSFFSVYMNSAADGWTVGQFGIILHYDGSNWGSITSPTLTTLNSISFGPPLTGPLNPNDGWAVGTTSGMEPTLIHWNGFVWTKGVAIGVTNDLNSVFMLSTGDVWTVGGGGNPTATCSVPPCPVILHFTGGSWNTVTPPPGSYILNSVFMVSPTEGWAVGTQGSAPPFTGIILHYTVSGGVGSWGIFPGPASYTAIPPLNSVFMLGPNEGWAVGNQGTVLHYTVTGGVGTWNLVTVSGLPVILPPAADLNSVFMLSPTSGWAVGGFEPGGPPTGPVILYWDGTHWTIVATPTIPGGPLAMPPVLKSVYCTGPSDCWSVGSAVATQIVATIFHWDGIAWSHVTLSPSLLGSGIGATPPNLNSVFMTSPSSGWIVGSPPTLVTVPATTPLATILRYGAFGGLLTVTSTSTVVSTIGTFTSYVTSTTSITTSFVSSNTTIAPPPSFSDVLIPVILGIVVALAVILVVLLLLLGRRRPRPRRATVLYPVPRRP